MPRAKGGLIYNHFKREAHIDQVFGERCLVMFREEHGITWSVSEVWYSSEEKAVNAIRGFVG